MNSKINVGTGLIIRNADGTVWGRSVPRKDGRGVAVIRREMAGDKPCKVLCWGPVEYATKAQENGWDLQPSYLLVTSVTYDAATKTVTVLLTHNLWEGWNQCVTVPFGGNWRQEVYNCLYARSMETGSETHVGNSWDLLV